jgi:N6-adenosine-specific RNA methylase IME4
MAKNKLITALALPAIAPKTAAIRLLPTGLEIRDGLSEADWLEAGRILRTVEHATQWWIGDWLAFGEMHYGKLTDAAEILGISHGAAKNYSYVSQNVDRSLRNDHLEYHHHVAVAPLAPDDQRRWLDIALRDKLSVSALRAAIQRDRPDAPPLPAGTYAVIYADPPWEFANSGFVQSAASVYPTMSMDAIADMAVPAAPDSALFLWVPNSLLPDGLTVVARWGFDYKTCFVWVKDRAPGMGWYCQTHHETLLFGVKGDPPLPRTKPRSVLEAPVAKHSQKPLPFYDLIESMYAGPYLELFARAERDGWKPWGNEAVV